MTLVEFLTARLDEDERVARAVKPLGEVVVMGGEHHPETFGHARYTVASADGYPRTLSDPEASRHFARHDPAAVLADIAAKRAIIAMHTGGHECPSADDNCAWWIDDNDPCPTLRLMASVYSDHSGYNSGWKP